MREEEERAASVQPLNRFRETDHPWVEMPVEDDSLGESVRFSLDEIRYA